MSGRVRQVESEEWSTEDFGNRYVPDGLVAFFERLRRDRQVA